MTDGDGDAADREIAVESERTEESEGSEEYEEIEGSEEYEESAESGSGADGVTAEERTHAEKYGEPEEFDPRDRFGDPENEMVSVPEVDVPEVENPADRLPDPSDVDKEIKDAFWTAVLWMNLALACLTLGPLYAILNGGTRIGGAATVVGLFAAVRLYQTVRAFRQGREDDDESSDVADDSDTGK